MKWIVAQEGKDYPESKNIKSQVIEGIRRTLVEVEDDHEDEAAPKAAAKKAAPKKKDK